MIDQIEQHPGKVGLELMRSCTPPAWLRQPDYDFSVFQQHARKGELDHRTVAFQWYTGRPALHKYDKNAQHLGAAGAAHLGIGAPVHVVRPDLSSAPGLWHVRIEGAPPTNPALPPLIDDNALESWEYTPVVQELHKRGYKLRLIEAYLFAEGREVLRPFYERMRTLRADALASGDAQYIQRIKRIYAVTFGVLARAPDANWPGYLYRPDWWFNLVAYAKVVMYCQMERIYQREGIAPTAVDTDALYYDQPVQGLVIGTGIGQFKHSIPDQKERARIEGGADDEEE